MEIHQVWDAFASSAHKFSSSNEKNRLNIVKQNNKLEEHPANTQYQLTITECEGTETYVTTNKN